MTRGALRASGVMRTCFRFKGAFLRRPHGANVHAVTIGVTLRVRIRGATVLAGVLVRAYQLGITSVLSAYTESVKSAALLKGGRP